MEEFETSKNFNWFPGHMAKAKREMTEKMKLVDLVIELRDARIPYSSANPMLEEVISQKPRLILLNKSSMADPQVTSRWITYYQKKRILALDIDLLSGYHTSYILKYCHLALMDVFAKREEKKITSHQIKAMVVGIPNVGKSTFINFLARRKATQVQDRPGVTKKQTWIKVDEDTFLLDTPGVLWPKFEDATMGIHLALSNSIKEDLIDRHFLVTYLLKFLKEFYPNTLFERYHVDIPQEEETLLENIGRKRGFLFKGGIVDIEKTETMLLNELRTGKLGAMSFERPKD